MHIYRSLNHHSVFLSWLNLLFSRYIEIFIGCIFNLPHQLIYCIVRGHDVKLFISLEVYKTIQRSQMNSNVILQRAILIYFFKTKDTNRTYQLLPLPKGSKT